MTLNICQQMIVIPKKHHTNKVSPMIAPPSCLKEFSSRCVEKENSERAKKTLWVEETELRFGRPRQSELTRGVLEWRRMQRESSGDLKRIDSSWVFRKWSVHACEKLRKGQRKNHLKQLEITVLCAHKVLGTQSSPNSQTWKPQTSYHWEEHPEVFLPLLQWGIIRARLNNILVPPNKSKKQNLKKNQTIAKYLNCAP